MRFTRHQLLALVLGAGMATVLPAQGRVGGGVRGGRQMDTLRGGRQMDSVRARRLERMDTAQLAKARERLAANATPAGMILNLRERLGLTDDQVNRLETLKAAYVEPGQAELPKLREELASASKGEADLKAVRAAMNKINEATTNALVARLDARNKARAVLNADQQVKFDDFEARRPMQEAGMIRAGVMGRGARGGEPPAGAAARRGGRGGADPARPPV